MSPINKITILGVLILAGALVHGCGSSTPNSQAAFSATAQQHKAGWLPAGHMTAAQSDETACTECHGSDLSGGISGVSCSQCHLGGVNSVHPETWSQNTATAHASYVASNGNAPCANINCHGADLTGVAGSGPSCTSCHMGGVGSVHPTDWGALTYYEHALYTNTTGTASCANASCHGAALTGVSGSGPSCTSCHLGGVYSVHPADWATDITNHAQYVASKGASSCQNVTCHGANLEGVYASGPGCYVCH